MPFKDEKKIINGVYERKNSYYNSTAYGIFKQVTTSIEFAVNQNYQPNEQVTRSGFYLSTLTSMFQSFIETVNQIYREADPLFVHDTNRLNGGEFAKKTQWYHNRVWENMGPGNNGGTSQWLALCKDVPVFGMAVAHPHWIERVSEVEKANLKEVPYIGSMLEYQSEWNFTQNEPEIMRIHPYNWFGQWIKADNLEWEGFLDEWPMFTVQNLMNNKAYDTENLKKLAEEMQKGKPGLDKDYFVPNEDQRNETHRRNAPIVAYWGTINHIKGHEDDPREYHIVCDNKRVYKMEVNKMPGYRSLVRVRSEPYNDSPFGRPFLAPNLTHQRIMNVMTNLGIDEAIMNIHNGWAAWSNSMQNPNDFMNPVANGTVWMKETAKADQLPQRIGGTGSGILNDLNAMTQIINQDSQKTGLSDQRQALRGKPETATGRLLLERADNRKVRNAIIEMTDTGLVPLGKMVFLLSTRNTPEIQRRNLTYNGQNFDFNNQDAFNAFQNFSFQIHDSVTKDQALEVDKLMNFFQVAQGALTTVEGGADKVMGMIAEIGRRMKIKELEKYFPTEELSITTTQQAAPEVTQEISPPVPEGAALPPEQLAPELL